MKKHELMVTIALLAVILVLGYLIATTGMAEQRVREEAQAMEEQIEALEQDEEVSSTQPVEPETVYVVQGDRFTNFGTRTLFDVPIKRPTPTPAPTPTPLVPPTLDQVLASWKLQGIVGTKALLQDQNTQETFMLEVNGEARMATFSAFAFMIQLVGIDKKAYAIEVKSDQHPEPYRIEMFPSQPAIPELPQ